MIRKADLRDQIGTVETEMIMSRILLTSKRWSDI